MKEVVFLVLFSVVLLLTSSLVMPLVMFTQQYALRQLLAAPIFGMFCVIALHKVPRVGALSIIGVFSGSVLLFMSPIMFVNNILGAIMAEILVVCFFGDYKKHGARLFSAMVYTPLTLPLTLITTSILRGEQIFSLLGNPLLASVFSLGTVLLSFLGAKLGVKIVEELKKAGKLTWAS